MPAGPYNTRASNSQWNPGLPADLPDKARSNFLNIANKPDRGSSKRPAGGSTTHTGDPKPNDAADSLPRPKPRAIFNKNKQTGKHP